MKEYEVIIKRMLNVLDERMFTHSHQNPFTFREFLERIKERYKLTQNDFDKVFNRIHGSNEVDSPCRLIGGIWKGKKGSNDYPNPKDIILIVPMGIKELERLENKESKENQEKLNKSVRNIQKWNVIVMGVLVIATIIIAGFQIDIANKQTDILEQSSIPLKPYLELYVSLFNNKFAYAYQKEYELDLDKQNPSQSFDIEVFNRGKIPTGEIKPYLLLTEEYRNFIDYKIEPNSFELNSIEKRKFNIRIYCKDKEICSDKFLNTGIFYVNFYMYCPNCEERHISKEIPLCIYNDNLEKECD